MLFYQFLSLFYFMETILTLFYGIWQMSGSFFICQIVADLAGALFE